MSFHLRKESAKYLSEGKSTEANATKVQVLNQMCHSTKEETVQITSEKKDEVWVLKKKIKLIWKDEQWRTIYTSNETMIFPVHLERWIMGSFFLPICIPNSSMPNNKHIFILNTTAAKHPSCLGNARKKTLFYRKLLNKHILSIILLI